MVGVIVRRVNVKMSINDNIESNKSVKEAIEWPTHRQNNESLLTNHLFLERQVNDLDDGVLHEGDYFHWLRLYSF